MLAGTVAAAGGQARRAGDLQCPQPQSDPAYAASVGAALASKRDVWGDELLRAPGGPTYAAARSYLHPLMLVGPPAGSDPRRLTDSGVYYLAFGRPDGDAGTTELDLHVADGSQIVSRFVRGRTLSVDVGAAGERYGSCLARLTPPRLAGGYLPILRTGYADTKGIRYTQTSFATRIPETRSLVSFVRVTGGGRVRFDVSVRGVHRVGNQLRVGRKTLLVFGPRARVHGRVVTFPRGPAYVAWISRPSSTKPFRLDAARYLRARRSVLAYWHTRLARGALLSVPDRVVMNAERNLLLQNLSHAWRYSLANRYERFSWELLDVAEVMGAYGYTGVERAIVAKSFRRDSFFPNRADGERMSGVADYYRRTHDGRFVRRFTDDMWGALARFELQLKNSATGLLDPERYGYDVGTPIYGLHDQALVLQGLRSMAGVWAQVGYGFLAQRATGVADQLEQGLRAAVAAAEVRLADGSLFVPIALVDGNEHPYDTVTESLAGSYWNLVMPYALASGLFAPGSPEADGLLRYMQNHGSSLLGLVRFRAFGNSGKPGYRAPGVDDVYGTNYARFLADNDQADRLALSLYGKLGADMTPLTFVSGEGSTVGPVEGEYYRSMFRPPNSANNSFFLETLRLMLVHETRDALGAPNGLELAYATPRRWLEAGRTVAVRGVRTSFGPLSYSFRAGARAVRGRVVVPPRLGSATLKLRLRAPADRRIVRVTVGGRAFDRFDAGTETIDLTGLHGRLSLVATLASR